MERAKYQKMNENRKIPKVRIENPFKKTIKTKRKTAKKRLRNLQGQLVLTSTSGRIAEMVATT